MGFFPAACGDGAQSNPSSSNPESASETERGSVNPLTWYHSGILVRMYKYTSHFLDFFVYPQGVCALVEAYPYEVPPFVPSILVELEAHIHAPQPVPRTVKRALQEFKRTHMVRFPPKKIILFIIFSSNK